MYPLRSPSYFRYWGKVRRDVDDDLSPFHLLPYHCLDVAAVGHVLMERHVSWVNTIARGLTLNPADLQRFLLLCLLLHDVGKFGSSFQGCARDVLFLLQGRRSAPAYAHRHDALGMALWDDELLPRLLQQGYLVCDSELTVDVSECLSPGAQAVFGHHGYPVTTSEIFTDEQFTCDDIEAACDFLSDCAALLVREPIVLPDDLTELYDALKVQSWLLSGFVILCDWIGSNERFFPHCSEVLALDRYREHACKRAEHAVEEAGILSVPSARFAGMGGLFPRLRDVVPSPLQTYVSQCDLPAGPQLWLVEDITGSGKTEAAVLLTHRLMQQGSDGVFVALPTMATANAMYDRMAEAYRYLFSADGRPSLALAHGRRNLMDGFTSTILDFEGQRVTVDFDKTEEEPAEASAECALWIADNKKKVFLAHAGVGTVDQALLAVLPAKHHTLRLLGLSSKVLVVDEVHACDAYMAELLEALLEFHAAMGGSAILLSATIPQAMRTAFTCAFLRGLNLREIPQLPAPFPSVTLASADECRVTQVEPRSDLRRSLAVTLVHEEESVLREILNAAASGACVCWVRNTVADAVEAYERLSEETLQDSIQLMLFHARYAMGHRLDKEEQVRTRFGKHSEPGMRRGGILIATQVVEQSLDLDFDFMVSDLAPIDVLIQRAGRIQRHHREFRGDRTNPILWAFSPPLVESPGPAWFSGFLERAAYVYEDHGQLWRTARLVQRKGGWTMPDDARDLIERVYDDERGEEIPAGLVKKQNDAEGKRRADKSQGRFNRLSVTTGYGGHPSAFFSDVTAPTRLGESSVTLRLAIRSGERILPLCDHPRDAWMLSEVQVRESLVARSIATEIQKQRAAATMRDRGKWSELVILEQEGPRLWAGKALDRSEKPIELVYSLDTGLKVEKGIK